MTHGCGWNVLLSSCRYHSLCRLPDLHPPQEGHLKWHQRSEKRSLWILFRPGLDLRPSPLHQRLLVRAPAQAAVREVQLTLIQLTAVLVQGNENEHTALKVSFFGLLPHPPKRATVRQENSVTSVVFLPVRLYLVLSPDQAWNKVIAAQTLMSALMSYIDSVLAPPAALRRRALHIGLSWFNAVQQGVPLSSCNYSSFIVRIVNFCFLCFPGEKCHL